jgi:glycosyltransferase involved in cell wall biosynthesis
LDGEIPRMLRAAECGQAVAVGDSAGLAAAILRLRDDAGLKEVWGRNARVVLEERFERRKALEAWVEVLEEVEPRERRR